ncbi:hypothetical protein BCV72DRAFT_314470 [Rhizopus microsporus var. microsporus]|uniref:Uncharacterized protein n=2 Tax=Rhizopus microsporus TaxID=58291 RepID=A0A2G4SPR4_RHIZD|nr:uncharacterized protein RHIMIDRAFT_245237 [Rhizopus microsporus ATCC 52813]ORE10359.1 hypothetical protein BCV72DRAFT_314470 [Rhizopus microsporus var. microsporus]PHZ10761.1 hypothetical protein RHIMIDRAFT_245237 [Rhizopus microsporus ATCC 52813]
MANIDYKLNYKFKEVQGDLVVENIESKIIFKVLLRYPPRYWKHDPISTHETAFKKQREDWERITTIPLTKTNGPKPRLKEPILPVVRPNTAKIGVWTVLRITFNPLPRNITVFERELGMAVDFNLVPRDSSKMKPTIKVTETSRLPFPLTYLDQVKYNFESDLLYLLESVISYHYIDEYNMDGNFHSTIKALGSSVVHEILVPCY